MIIVTAATGQLGTAVVAELLQLDPGQSVIATTRRTEVARHAFQQSGVEVRSADYDEPDSLARAFDGGTTLLLVSGTEFGRRVRQHADAIAAARAAGVERIVYTSAPRVDSHDLVFGPEHLATEQLLHDADVGYTILRNNWYHENYEPAVRAAVASGRIVGSARSGRVASAARGDYAAAAARVLLEHGHENRTYELSGDTAWTYAELADLVARASGREIRYVDVPLAQRRANLLAEGLGPGQLDAVAGIEDNIAAGALDGVDGSLARLIGRPTRTMADAVERFVARIHDSEAL